MKTTVSYQCPNCSAGLVFDADKQKFTCEFCLSEFTEEELAATDSAKKAEEKMHDSEEFNSQMNEYDCPNCGAQVIADQSTAADFCPYCHTPVVLVGRLSGQMKPDRVIPFKYDKDAAKAEFLKWTSKKKFLPADFFSEEQLSYMSGVYYPFWVTDADTYATLDATATKIRVWRSGDTEYTETSRFNIVREGDIHFEDIVTSAFSEADKKMLEGILPYPSDSLKEFSMPYLLGYTAKKRDIDRESLSEEVRARINNYAETMLRGTIGPYSTTTVNGKNVNIKKSNWEYALMPVWILTYKDKKNKVYTYAMNGHTGKIYGELPISFKKLWILFGSIAAALTAVCSVIGGLAL